jgi:hypothetical protein
MKAETPVADFKVAVSAENTPYIAWQTLLFCFSALRRLGKYPTVVVHRSAAALLPEFEIVRSWGFPVVEAPQFRNHPKGEYPPRNELGSLLTIACLPEFKRGHVLFCEPDMLFVKRPQYASELSAEHYTYLDYTQKRVCDAARKFGLEDRVSQLNETSPIGVPYLIPASELGRIARRWIEVLDSFEELQWIDIMYAFGLALAIEGLTARKTEFMAHNYDPLKKLDRDIIHYCYGDWRWDKRAFKNGHSPLTSGPLPPKKGLSGTVLGEILNQLQQARAYSQFPNLSGRILRLAAAAVS